MLVGLEIGPVVSEKKIKDWGILVRLNLMNLKHNFKFPDKDIGNLALPY